MQTLAGKPFTDLTAADLMTPDPIVIPKHMSLRAAAHVLSRAHISGAPVIDGDGRCVGVLSATDFVRYTEGERGRDTYEIRAGCVCADWQIIEVDKLPADEVAAFMTTCPVTAAHDTPITELARTMLEAHIHRLIVVDPEGRLVGVVSTSDILAAVAMGNG